jgi:uncharacterized membrane protein
MDDETVLSKNRIEVLTDGIFAVVMTLSVLDNIEGLERISSCQTLNGELKN